jgi:hypothetical protein
MSCLVTRNGIRMSASRGQAKRAAARRLPAEALRPRYPQAATQFGRGL